jgi:flavoprotein
MLNKKKENEKWLDAAKPTGGTAGKTKSRTRIAWAVTGSGHFLTESLEICSRIPNMDLFLSSAAEEVLPIYGFDILSLKKKYRVFRDKTASSVPVGMLYDNVYHTVVIAPATSNTVAKCALGLSDSLPTNMFAQAGKLGILSIVFACDTAPVVITKAPREWVELNPRKLEFKNVRHLKKISHTLVVESLEELELALTSRLKNLGLAWKKSSL